jgi:hypothetical protein
VLTTSMKHIHSTAIAAEKRAIERDQQIHLDVQERDAHLARLRIAHARRFPAIIIVPQRRSGF